MQSWNFIVKTLLHQNIILGFQAAKRTEMYLDLFFLHPDHHEGRGAC
jgi:hypothetical protein